MCVVFESSEFETISMKTNEQGVYPTSAAMIRDCMHIIKVLKCVIKINFAREAQSDSSQSPAFTGLDCSMHMRVECVNTQTLRVVLLII